MTWFVPDWSSLAPSTQKNKNPLWCEAARGMTAEMPDGIWTGLRLEHTQNHIINYRLSGPAHWSQLPMTCGNTAVADYSGILYIPIYMPPTRTGDDRSLALWMYNGGPRDFVGTESHIKYREATFGSGDWTTLYAETFGAATEIGPQRYTITYTPPSGTGADSVKCIEIKIQNLDIASVCAYHLPLRTLDSDQFVNAPGDCSPGRYICDHLYSIKGLIYAVGDGTANVESLERLTRRTFFNQSHVFGSYISSSEALSHTNMMGDMRFGAQCRNLLGDDAPVYCVPCAVIECTGQSDAACTIELQFKSTASLETWTYTVQTTDPEEPIFVHPWRTGSSSANGLSVYSNTDDNIQVNAHVVGNPGVTAATLTLRAWALFEGPAW